MKRHIRHKKLYAFLAIIFIGVLVFKFCINHRYPVSPETFKEALVDVGYDVYSEIDPSSGDYKYIEFYRENKTKIENFDDDLSLVYSLTARKIRSNTEVLFKVYRNEQDATTSYIKLENSKNFMVSRGDFSDYTRDSQNDIHRIGENYALYYIKDLEDNYFMVSRIDNTVLIAYMDASDIKQLNKVFNALGYGINS